MEAYCVKCRAKREIQNAEQTTLKNGRPATRGKCPTCGTNVFRIGKSQNCVDSEWGGPSWAAPIAMS